MTTRILDWAPRFDERSLKFGIPRKAGAPVRKLTWRHGPLLDQGQEGACVGFASEANLGSTKRAKLITRDDAQAIYRAAQKLDEFPDTEEGTSVLAGMKAMRTAGQIKSYAWSFGLTDVLHALSYHGPVQIGVNWYSGMFDPDSAGLLHVTGRVEGGHCTLLSGVDPASRTVIITNSWGASWGRNGQARLGWDDLDTLLGQQGEAVTILKP